MPEHGQTACIIQSRMGSSRLPGKALADIAGRPLLVRVLERLSGAASIGCIIVATTDRREDDVIEALARSFGAECYRGSEHDVLGRVTAATAQASRPGGPTWSAPARIVHACGDNPLVEPELVDMLVERHVRYALDYAFLRDAPLGLDVGVFSAAALRTSAALARSPHQREHVNAFVIDESERFRVLGFAPTLPYRRPDVRLTVDTPEDLALVRSIWKRWGRSDGTIDLRAALAAAEAGEDLFLTNAGVKQRYGSEGWRRIREGAR